VLDLNQITRILPHRYPMLLVDRILEVSDDGIVGLKNVTANEPFFQGHFPGYPVMPGVLIVEAMAQVGGVLALKDLPDRDSWQVLFGGIEDARFRHPVVPGDQLRLEITVLKKKATVWKLRGVATVAGRKVAEATLLCVLTQKAPAG